MSSFARALIRQARRHAGEVELLRRPRFAEPDAAPFETEEEFVVEQRGTEDGERPRPERRGEAAEEDRREDRTASPDVARESDPTPSRKDARKVEARAGENRTQASPRPAHDQDRPALPRDRSPDGPAVKPTERRSRVEVVASESARRRESPSVPLETARTPVARSSAPRATESRPDPVVVNIGRVVIRVPEEAPAFPGVPDAEEVGPAVSLDGFIDKRRGSR